VFTTALGSKMDAANVRRDLRRASALVPGLDPLEGTPRELRHSFVSVLSDAGVPVEQISQLVFSNRLALAVTCSAASIRWPWPPHGGCPVRS
jgi:site-specific recombinase XerD